MGQQKLTGLNETLAAIPAKTLAAMGALGFGGAAVEGSQRAPLLSEMVLFHIAGHGVTLPVLAMIVGLLGGSLALLKVAVGALARLHGAARRIRR